MNIEKQKAFIIHVIYIIFLLGIVYVGIKYLLPLLMPFVIGVILALIFRKPIDMLNKKFRVNRILMSILILIIFYGVLGVVASMIGFKAFGFLSNLFYSLPSLYETTVLPAIQQATDEIIRRFPDIEFYLEDILNNISNSIIQFLTNASSAVVGFIARFAASLPNLLINLIFTIVSSFFFTIDYHRITRFLILQIKPERREMILKLKDNGIGTIGKFIRAYATIISITFLELSIGFWILGIANPFLFGALVAIIDVMPILGTGAVLLPWAIISLIIGNTKIGVGMLLLYVVITAIRQAIEPRIVGQQIGLHPIITLILMYVGAQLMGVLGLFILPIIATIIVKLNDDGSIHFFKKT